MATTIRLARHGAKKNPIYRIVVASTRSPRDGRRLEQIGTYDPNHDPEKVTFKTDKLTYWLSKGALPSQTVAELIKRHVVSAPTAAAEPAEAQA